MPMENTSEAEIRALLNDVANQLRFLTESGVFWLSKMPVMTPPGTSSPPPPPASVSLPVHLPETSAGMSARSPVAAPPLVSVAPSGGGPESRSDSTPHCQQALQSCSKADAETLSRTPEDCNRPDHRFSRPQQHSLFGEEISEAHQPSASISTRGTPDVSLEAIRADLGECQRCKLAAGRTNIVFGEGSPQASVAFVGEGPGADEDATGRPFVGRAGQLLDKIIAAMGLRREEVYICNVVKCRPPENRTPEPDEVAACVGFLHRQLAVIRPRVIVALGASAASALLDEAKLGSISKIRGRFRDYHGIPLMPTFHPAYLLRAPDKKREVWEDIKQVMALLREPVRPA